MGTGRLVRVWVRVRVRVRYRYGTGTYRPASKMANRALLSKLAKLYVKEVCVCVQELCVQERVVCRRVVCVKQLCVKQLYATELCVKELRVSELCLAKLCERVVWQCCARRTGGGGRGGGQVQSGKTRTSDNDVGNTTSIQCHHRESPSLFLVLKAAHKGNVTKIGSRLEER